MVQQKTRSDNPVAYGEEVHQLGARPDRDFPENRASAPVSQIQQAQPLVAEIEAPGMGWIVRCAHEGVRNEELTGSAAPAPEPAHHLPVGASDYRKMWIGELIAHQ